MNKLISNFKELNSKDSIIAGGKGASLGKMMQAGIPVPDGFVILSTAFDQFIKDTDLIQEINATLNSVHHEEIHTVENASEKIQGLIKSSTIPENIAAQIKKQFNSLGAQFVAVRSSATAEDGVEHAWAGQLDSYLNTTEKDLLEKVQNCWASLFTPRAIFYRFENGLHSTQISVAVVVQKMVNSEVSGIAFSVHPVTEDRNQLIIEAGFGLGEAIVSGSITPDSYVIEKEPRNIIDINISIQRRGLYRIENGGNEWIEIKEPKASSQVLNEIQILELSEMIIGIENHYGFPCDIEWAFENEKFYIVQSRPITTLHTLERIENNNDSFKLVNNENKDAFIAELKNIDWKYWLNRPYSVFMATLFWEGVREDVFSRNNFKKLGPNNHLYQFPDLFYDINFLEKGVVFFEKYFDTNKMSDLSDALEELHKHHIVELNKLVTDKEKTIPEKTKVFSNLIQDYIPYIWIITNLEDYFNKKIASEVPRHIKGDYSKFVGDISLPSKKNIYVLMIDEIKAGISNKEIVKKYGWMRSRDGFTDFYTEEEIAEIRNGIDENESHDIIIPEGLIELSNELKELNFFRTSRTDKFYEFFGVARPLMKEIAKHVGVSFKELANYDTNSIIAGQPEKYIKEFNYGLIGNRYLISNEILISDFKKHEGVDVRGKTAYKGLVNGIAKIVTHPEDIKKVKDGDILIAQMTFPSYISAMQKAAAFVTDEGSITCHAAIIAREMKKPCIIGTVAATKILKDGDFIEVDANNGIVRVIKKGN